MANHFYRWDTFGGDEFGQCPYPSCRPGMMANVPVNVTGHMIVTSRVCRYCWARFAPARPTDMHCSKTCKARTQAWDAWIRETQREASYGRTGPKNPRGGASLAASTERFELTFEAVA